MHIVSKNISSSTITDWLRILTPFQFGHPETQAGLANLFGRINNVRGERNAYVHGLWSAGSVPTTAEVMTIRWERTEIMKSELVTTSDLDGLLADIGEIQGELVMLGDKIGFHLTGKYNSLHTNPTRVRPSIWARIRSFFRIGR